MKKIVLGFVSLVIMLAFVLNSSGCARILSAQEVSAATIDSAARITTVRMDINMDMAVEIVGGSQAGRMPITMKGSIQENVPAKEMAMAMDMSMDIPEQGMQSFTTNVYMSGGWIYMKVPETGQEQWMKMKLDEQLWNNQDQFALQINFLESALNVTKLDDEKVNGVDCYVIQVNPDMATLMDWVASQNQSTSELKNINPEVFKTTSIKEWVAKDGSLPQKSEVDILMEMTPADIGNTGSSSPPDFEKTTITISGTVNYFDYGKPVNIEIPVEAAGAREISSSLQTANP